MQNEDDSYEWVLGNARRKAFLLSFDRPMIKSEINAKSAAFTSINSNIRLGEFLKRNLVICLTPLIKEGRVYGLSEEGKSIAKRLSEPLHIKYDYSEPDIDWGLYGKIACGKRKRAILGDIVEKGRITTISNRYRARAETIKGTPRSYKYRIIGEFLKSALVRKVIENSAPVYVPTEKAKRIKELLQS
ncbi:MAG: hypothetical protein ABII64_02345 [Elusimicrobiota bacterium]